MSKASLLFTNKKINITGVHSTIKQFVVTNYSKDRPGSIVNDTEKFCLILEIGGNTP